MSPRTLRSLRELNYPLTKAGYVRMVSAPESPDFPLDADIKAEIPRGLPRPCAHPGFRPVRPRRETAVAGTRETVESAKTLPMRGRRAHIALRDE